MAFALLTAAGQSLFILANVWVVPHELPQVECAEGIKHWPLLGFYSVVLSDGREIECGRCSPEEIEALIIEETTCGPNRP